MTPALENDFAREVCAGLAAAGQKTLPCRYLYDDVGSALFDAITYLSEYGLTRADARILQTHAADITGSLPGTVAVAELGSGSGIKTRALLQSLSHQPEVRYFPIELSGTALARCAQDLELLAEVVPIQESYLDGMAQVMEKRRSNERLLVLFLGSTIGNFEPGAAADFLAAVRASMREGDGLLLGTDLVKPLDRMLAAYDDPAGVTAAFNLNLLSRINKELGADFNLRHFHHEARYNPESQRIEMHLRSRDRQKVRIREAMMEVDFAAGETIRTEVCYKFREDQIAGLARAAGFRVTRQWVDEQWGFAESLLVW